MVNLQYVKKRKRNKIIALCAAIGSIVVLAFGIVAFLGQRTGSFTVSLKTSDVQLALSTSSSFENQTSYLRVEDLGSFKLYCVDKFRDPDSGDLDFSNIDTEEVSSDVGIQSETGDIRFFKYTFFIKNIGSTSAQYDMDINILNDTRDNDTQKRLTPFLRVCVIEDGAYTVYAKESNSITHYSRENPDNMTTFEYVDGNPTSSKYHGLAEKFTSDSTVCHRQTKNFNGNDVKRYTIVFWLEGDDEQAIDPVPRDCKLRLGVEIQAYEN